jgi:hypothetical protein
MIAARRYFSVRAGLGRPVADGAAAGLARKNGPLGSVSPRSPPSSRRVGRGCASASGAKGRLRCARACRPKRSGSLTSRSKIVYRTAGRATPLVRSSKTIAAAIRSELRPAPSTTLCMVPLPGEEQGTMTKATVPQIVKESSASPRGRAGRPPLPAYCH